jgi:small subunit ribosomal protein S20
MAHTKSAKKHHRQSKKRRVRNRAAKSSVKTQVKSLLNAVQEAPLEEARETYRLTVKKLDQAAAKGVIHPNLAARKKSRLARMLNNAK